MQRCPTCHNAFSNKRAHACVADSGADLARALHELAAKVEAQGRRIEAQDRRIEAQDRRIEAQDQRIEAQDQRIEAQDQRIEAQERQLAAQKLQLDAQEGQTDAQKRQVEELLKEAKRGASLLPDAPPLVFGEADMLVLVQDGLKAFVRRHRWPLSALGKTVFFCDAGEWTALTPVLMNRLAADVMKQLSILLMAYVKAHGLLDHDPEGRYLEYSQTIHEMEPGQLKRAILDSSN